MLEKLTDVYKKYEKIVKYLIFGGLTTVVNFVAYFILSELLNIDKIVSNILAWMISVLFAFFTNKIFVFKHQSYNIKSTFFELGKFFGCRCFSGVFDTGMFALFVSVFHFNDFIVKIFTQCVVVILNYIFSKLIIFK